MRYVQRRLLELGEAPRYIAESRPKVPVNMEARREYHREYSSRTRKSGLGRVRMMRSNLKQTHGITLEAYNALMEAQHGRCAICAAQLVASYDPASEPGSRGPKPHAAHIDHDHDCCPGRRSCGVCIRGLLCSRCNTGLGAFRDDSGLLLRALGYLERCRAPATAD